MKRVLSKDDKQCSATELNELNNYNQKIKKKCETIHEAVVVENSMGPGNEGGVVTMALPAFCQVMFFFLNKNN